VTHLRRYLEQTGAVAPEQLDAALRRQQIYGGSLDTVLLELEICDPQTLNEMLAQACGLPVVPVELLDNGIERPWGALPNELVEIGWAAPLTKAKERIVAAVHPDLPNERLGELYRALPGVVPLVTPECCLEKVAAERVQSVVPQRYAVLCAGYVSALRRRPSVSDVGFAILPDLPTSEETHRGPAPPLVPKAEPPGDPAIFGPNPERVTDRYGERPRTRTQVVPTQIVAVPTMVHDHAPPGLVGPEDDISMSNATLLGDLQTPPRRAPDRPAASAGPSTRGRTQRALPVQAGAKVVRPPSFGPKTEEGAPKFVAPQIDSVPSSSTSSPRDAPTRPPVAAPATPRANTPVKPEQPIIAGAPPVRFTARGTMITTRDRIDAELREAELNRLMSGAKTRLQEARTRDAAVEALVQAAMVVSPRVGLFRIRDGALHGLGISRSAIRSLDGAELPLEYGSPLSAAIAAGHWAGTTEKLGLDDAIGLRKPVPCMLHRIDVAGRPVMAIYLDHDGGEFLPAESNIMKELVASATEAFESVLKARRAAAMPPLPGPGDISDGPAPVAPPPAFGVTEPPGWGPPPVPLQAEYSKPPPARPTDLNPGRLMRRETKVDGSPPAHGYPISTRFGMQPPTIGGLSPTLSGSPTPPPLGGLPRDSSSLSGVPPPPPMGGQDDSAPFRHETLTGVPPAQLEDARGLGFDHGRPGLEGGPRFIPPPLDEHENSGIISLASPIDQPSARGRITLDDDEDWSHRDADEADESERRAVEGVLMALARGEADVDDLRALGDAGLRGLASQFPGPLEVLRRDLRALPPPSAHGPHIRVAIRLGPAIVPYLVELFTHGDPDVRFYAAFVFQELRDPRAMESLSRLAFDGSGDVRVIAMRVLETYARYDGFDRAALYVRSELDSSNRTRQLYAARAVGTLRDTEAIPKLIDQLSSKDRFIQEASLESLCSITGQQHGLKPHRWKTWFQEQGSRHRVEWIIDSLRHRDLPVRRWAHDELIRITGHRVAFSPLGDKKSREVAAEAWLSWWQTAGRSRMGFSDQPTG
jgi:hypothetical protein